MTTKKYDQKFKDDCCKMYLEGNKSMDRVSKDVGIGKSSLFKWVQKHKSRTEYKTSETVKKKIEVDADKKRIRELEKEIQELKEINKLIKKSMAIFCRDLDSVTSL